MDVLAIVLSLSVGFYLGWKTAVKHHGQIQGHQREEEKADERLLSSYRQLLQFIATKLLIYPDKPNLDLPATVRNLGVVLREFEKTARRIENARTERERDKLTRDYARSLESRASMVEGGDVHLHGTGRRGEGESGTESDEDSSGDRREDSGGGGEGN